LYVEANNNSQVIKATPSILENKPLEDQMEFKKLVNELQQNMLNEDTPKDDIKGIAKKILDIINKYFSDDEKLSCLTDEKGQQLLMNMLDALPEKQLLDVKNLIANISSSIESVKVDANLDFLNVKLSGISNNNKFQFQFQTKDNDISDNVNDNSKINIMNEKVDTTIIEGVKKLETVIMKLMDTFETDTSDKVIVNENKQPKLNLVSQPKEQLVEQIKKVIYNKIEKPLDVTDNKKVEKPNSLFEKPKLKIVKNDNIKLNKIISKEKIKPEFSKKSTNNSEELFTLVENKSAPINTKSIAQSKTLSLDGQIKVIDQIIEKVDIAQIKNGSVIDIKLKPDFLGSLSIKVEMGVDKISAEIVTNSTQVKEIITKQMGVLTSTLNDKGIKIDTIKVSVSSDANDVLYGHFNEQQNTNRQYKQNRNHYYENTNVVIAKEQTTNLEVVTRRGSMINVYI